jgi:hypothetical protein
VRVLSPKLAPFPSFLSFVKPAESDTHFFVHSGGSVFGCGIGSYVSGSDRKFDNTPRSFFEKTESWIFWGAFSAAFFNSSFRFCLKPFKKGVIWLTWFRLPINFWISLKHLWSFSLAARRPMSLASLIWAETVSDFLSQNLSRELYPMFDM